MRAEEGTNAGKPDEEVNLWPYFNPSAFSGYGRGSKNFYGVYGDLFATLARQVCSRLHSLRVARSRLRLEVPNRGGGGGV